MEKTFECPNCYEDVVIDYTQNVTKTNCPHCNVGLNINYDADHVNGSWNDLTSIHIDKTAQ